MLLKSERQPLFQPKRQMNSVPVRTKIRRVSMAEWRRWTAEASALPVTCDIEWAGSLETQHEGKWLCKPWIALRGDEEHLVVGYQFGAGFGRPLTLSPFGLNCAVASRSAMPSPNVTSAIADALALRHRSVSYTIPFYVRFACSDDTPLSSSKQPLTHVLDLDSTYEELFSRRFTGPTRTCIRRAEKSGIIVVLSRQPSHVSRYYELHKRLASEKGGYGELHPEAFLRAIVERSDRCEFAVALKADTLLSGGIFYYDGPTLFYWHAATDRSFTNMMPNYALLSFMIQRAIAKGVRFFNFGGSANIRSLEDFKEAWGATPRENFGGSKTNPLLRWVKTHLRRYP